ncbi:unnamed protein product [Paramecium sonneborni]|uniref:Uncharacterized protein n=1 Tax=Paramecium sonneborni TaxID=65129 RepID=A0A8S1L016_9CILI|nr:unnamed protein product [Paramecium sonneborni]
MCNNYDYQKFQQKIVCFQQELSDDGKNKLKFCYDNYKQLKSLIIQSQKYFSKFQFLIEFYDLLEQFQRDKQIQDYMQQYYYLLPIIFNNQIYSGILETLSYSQQEVQELLMLTKKLSKLDENLETNKTFMDPQNLKLKSILKRISINSNNYQEISQIPFQLCYQYFYLFYLKFQQNGFEVYYQNYSKLKQSLKKIKELFKQERVLYKLMNLNIQNLRSQKIPNWEPIELNIDHNKIYLGFKEKMAELQFDNQEIEFLSYFSLFCKSITNHSFAKKNYFQLPQISNSKNNQFQITSQGDDYSISFQLRDLIKNEILQQFKQKNRGLIEIQFSENSKYYFVLQTFTFSVHEVVINSNLLNLEIDLNYQEERYVNAKFYCNDQKIILISDLQIKLQSLNGSNFQIDKIFLIYNICLQNEILIKNTANIDKKIEIIGQLSMKRSIFIQIDEISAQLLQFYIL